MYCVYDKKIKPVSSAVIILAVILCALSGLFLAGCTGEEETKQDKTVREEYTEKGCSLELVMNGAEFTLADDLKLELTAAAPVGWNIEFEEPAKEFKEFVLTGEPQRRAVHDGSGKSVKSVMTLEYEPQLTGEFMLPEFKVKYVKGAEERVISSKPLQLKIVSRIADLKEAALKDIPGVMALQRDYFYWYLAGVVIAVAVAVCLVVLLALLLRKRAKYRAICKPFYAALKNLQRLEKSGSIEKGQDEAVCVQVSDILREYIEARFAIDAFKCTTEEFLNRISDNNLLINQYSPLLKEFLEKCDVVKFARYDANVRECHMVVESCREFVLKTKRDEISYNGEYGKLPGND